jgi:hypothetical protein
MTTFIKIIIFSILIAYPSLGFSQLNLSWYTTSGYVNNTVNLMDGGDLDASGNIYTCGGFVGPRYISGNDTGFSHGSYDFFVSKHDEFGNAIWTKTGGGSGHDRALSLKIDNAGYIYLIVQSRTQNFYFGTDTISGNANGDYYIFKIDPSGNLIWARSIIEELDGSINELTFSGDGRRIFVCGTLTSDTLVLNNDTLTSNVSFNAMTIMLDTSANIIWARNVIGISHGLVLFSDITNHVYFSGSYSDTIIIGQDTLPGSGVGNSFIMKYDSSGNQIWANRFNTSNNTYIAQIKQNVYGDLYLCGTSSSDTLVINQDTLMNRGHSDIFIAKIDSSGNEHWGKIIGSNQYENLGGIVFDSDGNIYLGGSFSGSSINIGSTVLINYNDEDFFPDILLALFDSTGANIWAMNAGGEYGESIVPLKIYNGKLITAGNLGAPPLYFGNVTIFSNNPSDNFVAQFDISTGNRENTLSKQFTIYPNPTTGLINISGTSPQNKKTNISVTNIFGKEFLKLIIPLSDNIQIDLSNFSDGIYFIKLESEQETFTLKCVKFN